MFIWGFWLVFFNMVILYFNDFCWFFCCCCWFEDLLFGSWKGWIELICCVCMRGFWFKYEGFCIKFIVLFWIWRGLFCFKIVNGDMCKGVVEKKGLREIFWRILFIFFDGICYIIGFCICLYFFILFEKRFGLISLGILFWVWVKSFFGVVDVWNCWYCLIIFCFKGIFCILIVFFCCLLVGVLCWSEVCSGDGVNKLNWWFWLNGWIRDVCFKVGWMILGLWIGWNDCLFDGELGLSNVWVGIVVVVLGWWLVY